MKTHLQAFYNHIFRDFGVTAKSESEGKFSADLRAKRYAKMRMAFSDEVITKADKPKFRSALRTVKAAELETALYGNTTDTLEEKYEFPSDREIGSVLTHFINVLKNYPVLKTQDIAVAKFKAFFSVAKIIGDFVEHNNTKSNEEAYYHAYKMLVVFGDKDNPASYFQSIDRYLLVHNFLTLDHPLHDALIFPLPVDFSDQDALAKWRKIIYDAGRKGFALFVRATDMQKKLIEVDAKLEERDKILINYKSALAFARSTAYKKASEYEALADLCIQYNLSEDIFNRALEVDNYRKETDLLPNIIVDGSRVDLPGYYLVKLPLNLKNPSDKVRAHAYVLGHITNCCQSIGGHSEQCVIDGITCPNNGFLVLLKDDSSARERKDVILTENDVDVNKLFEKCKLVGQGYFWRSKLGNLTIDSWENLHSAADDIAVKLLTRYAEDVVYQEGSTILQVTIGEGGGTPKEKFSKKAYAETIFEGTQYYDSMWQRLIFTNEKVQDKLFSDLSQELKDGLICDAALVEIILESTYPILRKEQFCSYRQVEALRIILKNPTFQDFLRSDAKHHGCFGIDLKRNSVIWILLEKLIELNLLTVENIKKSMTMWGPTFPLYLAERISVLAKLGQLDNELYGLLLDTPSIWSRLHNPQSLLHGAAYNKDIILVRAMLKRGADVDEKDIDGNTPLHLAVIPHRAFNEEEHLVYMEFIKDFLKAGADVNHKNHAGKTPLQLAQEGKDDELVQLLVKAIKPAPSSIGFFARDESKAVAAQVSAHCEPVDGANPPQGWLSSSLTQI